jgi:hypothetical protein
VVLRLAQLPLQRRQRRVVHPIDGDLAVREPVGQRRRQRLPFRLDVE